MLLSRPRINWIEIVGFRSFGPTARRIAFSSNLTCIWGANTQGKSSFAEALEFLITGQISRRTMIGSSVEEFADALRNAHVGSDVPTTVTIELLAIDGSLHEVRRTLVQDYGRRNDCRSVLEIDGAVAQSSALESLGLFGTNDPASSHVLMQHTLMVLLSARPTDRAAFFRAILDVADLEVLRQSVINLQPELRDLPSPDLARLEQVMAVPSLAQILEPVLMTPHRIAELERSIDLAIQRVLQNSSRPIPELAAARRQALRAHLEAEQSKTFRLGGFDQSPMPLWRAIDEDVSRLETFSQLRERISSDALRVADALQATLRIPNVAQATEAVDCPVCETTDALTLDRLGAIRQVLHSTSQAQSAAQLAVQSLGNIRQLLQSIPNLTAAATARALSATSDQRRRGEFTSSRMRSLLPADKSLLVDRWIVALRKLLRARRGLLDLGTEIESALRPAAQDIHNLPTPEETRQRLNALHSTYDAFVAEHNAYVETSAPLIEALRAVIAQSSETAGWRELLELADRLPQLQAALRDASAIQQVRRELEDAITAIDEARGQILDENFGELNEAIVRWWEMLRPGELSFFQGVARRPGATRTIDFQAGLAAREDRSDRKLRDAIAVFSHSQVHCLGLITFVARAIADGFGFVILDDPVISSDETHRAPFVHQGLANLIDVPMQVILLTQDNKLKRDVEHLFQHHQVAVFHLSLTDSLEGTVIEPHDGSVRAQLGETALLTKSDVVTMRKEGCRQLRDIAELILKKIIVKGELARGRPTNISSLNHSIEKLLPMSAPYITDPRHPGQMKYLTNTLSPGNHDDDPPNRTALVACLGIMKDLDRTYLS